MMPQPATLKVKRSPGALTIKVGESVDALAYLQHRQWHQLLLAGPTPNVVGARGNDLPGGYYYDPVSRQEYVVMAKGDVDWQKSAIRVEVSSLRELRFGLYSTQNLADVELEVWRGLREKPPTQWEALNTLVSTSFLLLPLPDPVTQVPDWTSVALRLLETLESSAVRHKLHSMSFRAPVYYSLREHSGVYGDVRQLRVELVCQASIACALHRASSERVVEDFQAISREIATKVVPLFYRSDLEMFENAYPDAALAAAGGLPDDPGVVDTWYALNNLVEVIHLCAAFPSQRLRIFVERSLNRWMKLAHDIGYVFPLFLGTRTGRSHVNGALNPSVGGIYAAAVAEAVTLFPEKTDLLIGEAIAALAAVRRFPIMQCYHQPDQLVHAARAALAVMRVTLDPRYRSWADDFLKMLLLMMYRTPANAGLFQGCAGMSYPAFRESTVALDLIADWPSAPGLPIAAITDLALANCAQFLAARGPLYASLPEEGIGTREVPNAGAIGTAIYASGGVFDLARIQHRRHGPVHRQPRSVIPPAPAALDAAGILRA